ncbi:MAG: hypothetical protein HQM01_11360 [Magnetococcales bacterium]|nr:hypothetical protein [Magnetococcales bacterium]
MATTVSHQAEPNADYRILSICPADGWRAVFEGRKAPSETADLVCWAVIHCPDGMTRMVGMVPYNDDIAPAPFVAIPDLDFAGYERNERGAWQRLSEMPKPTLASLDMDTPADEHIVFSPRVQSAFKNLEAGMPTLRELLEMSENDLLRISNIGRRSLDEIKRGVRVLGLKFTKLD